ncbi:hypothetical protein RND81_06G053300 [Saponaria officinalis]|uniref:TTF-type domain-containing protein n=1 Tax=Saponaria officinalis TaxID=3572 RepID=A0AAW1K4B8_SAPOF
MNRNTKISDFFKKRNREETNTGSSGINSTEATEVEIENQTVVFFDQVPVVADNENPADQEPLYKNPRVGSSNIFHLERDPGKRKPIWEYETIKEQTEIHAAYCIPCFLYATPSNCTGKNAFTIQGFRSWKKVNDGEKCAFLGHIERDHNSTHRIAVKKCNDLMKMEQHIDTIIDNITPEIIEMNRLRLKVSIFAIKWLTFQHCPLRGHDESVGSQNRGNFVEFLQAIASFSKDIESVVLNAPKNASYTSPQIQKEILSIFASKIREVIRKEIGDQKFCIIVDETKDISKREKMVLILRFVDKNGFIQERLFYLIHVPETTAPTLQIAITNCYDGASNMRGKWSGLQALFLNKCSYAYYVHCFAHRLQLALVAASREVISVYPFFSKLTFIVNIITSSLQRHDQLQAAYVEEMENLIELEELETRRGQNQVRTVKRAGDTRWDNSWESLLEQVLLFCHKHEIMVPYMEAHYIHGRGRFRHPKDRVTNIHYFRIEVFIAAVDSQLQELNYTFKDDMIKLLSLCSSLDPKENFQNYKADELCKLKINIKYQLELFLLEVKDDPELLNLKSISDLCQWLAKTETSDIYYLVDQLIRLVLTLPVSTATAERAFSAMKLIKSTLQKEIAKGFDMDSLVDEFASMIDRRALFKISKNK